MFITDRENFFPSHRRVLTSASMANKVRTAEERSTTKKPPNHTRSHQAQRPTDTLPKAPLHMWDQNWLFPYLTGACWEHRGCRLAPIGSARPNLVEAQPVRRPAFRQLQSASVVLTCLG